MKTDWSALREDLAWFKSALNGDAFLEPKSLLMLALPLSLVTSVLALEPNRVDGALLALAANFVGFAAVAVLVFAFHSWRAKKRVMGWMLPVTASLLIGAMKAAVTSSCFSWFMLGMFQIDYLRVSLGAIAGLVMLPITAVIVHALLGFEKERLELIRSTYQRELDLMTTKSEEEKLQKIRLQIDQLALGLEAGAPTNRVTPGELNLLRELVDKLVRPLSHSLYETIERRFPSFAWGPLLKRATTSTPPVIALGLLYIVAAPQTLVLFGPGSGLVVFLGGLVLIPAFTKFLFTVAKSFKAINPISFVLISTFSSGSAIALAIGIAGEDVLASWFYATTVSLWFVQSAVLFSAVNQARKAASRNRVELQRMRTAAYSAGLSGEVDLERREFANQLHGEVQSRMLGLALRTEGDDHLRRDLVVNELRLIRSLLSQARDARGFDFRAELNSVVTQWTGIAKVKIAIPDEINISNPTVAIRIVEQGIANAVRHGLANLLEVELSPAPNNQTLIRILDNGIGPTQGEHGLGFKLLASSAADWSFGGGPEGGSELRVLI